MKTDERYDNSGKRVSNHISLSCDKLQETFEKDKRRFLQSETMVMVPTSETSVENSKILFTRFLPYVWISNFKISRNLKCLEFELFLF